MSTKPGAIQFAVKCLSKECGQYVLDIEICKGRAEKSHTGHRNGGVEPDKRRPFGIGKVRVEPRIGAPLSVYVPPIVKQDYEEACLIKDLSPKASATLCRRALQGMIRDYWQVTKPKLHQELEAIKTQCDSDLYKAMMGLKSIGNIGAHPEEDINLIVDIDEGEPDALLALLRILDTDWYVARAEKKARLATVQNLGAVKAAAQKANAAVSPVPPSEP